MERDKNWALVSAQVWDHNAMDDSTLFDGYIFNIDVTLLDIPCVTGWTMRATRDELEADPQLYGQILDRMVKNIDQEIVALRKLNKVFPDLPLIPRNKNTL